jgi:aryl-alcohol dehydrogenase-like predicted oxidoreductase
MEANPLVLGTAQFGSTYGITNQKGEIDRSEAFSILSTAWDYGIRWFDTASGYNSEGILGEFVTAHGLRSNINVTTKVAKLSDHDNWGERLEDSIAKSFSNLKCDKIRSLFLHSPTDAPQLQSKTDTFLNVLEKWPIEDVGVSVYNPFEVLGSLPLGRPLAYQFPYNLLDKRFCTVDFMGGKRFARSTFLQGLLAPRGYLQDSAPVSLVKFYERYHQHLESEKLSALSMALSFTRLATMCDYVLVGVTSIAELTEIMRTSVSLSEATRADQILAELRPFPEWIINPRQWS